MLASPSRSLYTDYNTILSYGYVFLCLSLILIAIPIVVGTLMLRKKPGASTSPDEPLPPVA